MKQGARFLVGSFAVMLAAAIGPDAARPDGAPAAASDPLASKIQTYLAERASKDAFSGVVVLTRNGTMVFSGAYGLASKEYDVANAVDTKFNLGSINKLMTRIAIVQLVELHKLSFDDHIGTILTDYPNKDAAAHVTVRQLFEMTSGIGDFFGPAYLATPKERLRTLHDYVPLFASKPLAFRPGTQRRYSNGGFVVLGLIIERVAHQTYYDYVREHIFQPAGMSDSGWFEKDAPTPNLASGYTKFSLDGPGASWRNNMYTAPARGSSAGGGYSTAADLLKLGVALESNALLNARDSAAIVGPGIGDAGGAPGINADLEIDPHSGYMLVVLSNYDPPAAEDVAKAIRGWIGLE